MLEESLTILPKKYERWGNKEWFEASRPWSNFFIICKWPITDEGYIGLEDRVRIYKQFGAFSWLY